MLYQTSLDYYKDVYNTKLKTQIIRLDLNGDKLDIYLDATIFYPFGGGQPADQGTITTATGKAEVRNVQIKDGIVKHECRLIEGHIEDDQDAELDLDWERRHYNMRVHTAGHIIHDILTTMDQSLTPSRGDHGSKPYLEYAPEVQIDKTKLENDVNEAIRQGRSVTTRETSLDEINSIVRFVPPNLPKGKPLRIIQIEGFPAMPCGGTHVRDIKEIEHIEIVDFEVKKGKTTLFYKLV